MLEASPRLKKESSRIRCDWQHIIMADLALSGYSENEAFEIAYPETAGLNVKLRIARREKETSSDGYKRAYEERKVARKANIEVAESRNKEAVEREINTLINTTTDTKLKAELLMKLANLKQMTKEGGGQDEDTVQFHLPIDCSMCPLLQAYNDWLDNRNAALPQEEWETPVRPDEMQMIVERAYDEVERIKKAGA